MDFSTAIRYFTQDITWGRKFGIAALLNALTYFLVGQTFFQFATGNTLLMWIAGIVTVIPALTTLGYAVDISRNVRDGISNPLPEWSFKRQLKQGATLTFSAILYNIPILFLSGFLALFLLRNGSVPMNFLLLPLLAAGVGMLIKFVVATLQVNYVRHNTLRSCFRWKSIKFIIQNRWKQLLLVILFTMMASAVFGIVSSNFAGVIITALLGALSTFISGHLYGQVAALVDSDKLDAADPA